jgi:hypothetical protein
MEGWAGREPARRFPAVVHFGSLSFMVVIPGQIRLRPAQDNVGGAFSFMRC